MGGRKRQTFEQINSGTDVLLNQVDYNEVGQVMTKHLHSENSGTSWLQNIAYLYNERGWLTQNSAPLLNEQLRYNYGSSPLYNGNITEMQYSASNGGHTFDYTYDLLNRLTISSATGGTLSEGINYDYLGNIINLTRGGQPYTGSLTYAYTGNHLTGVTGTGFAGRTYSYDGNGNATTDGAVSSPKTISYNILNLPKSLTQSSSTIATYVYDAAGTKLRNTSVADSTWDYVSGIVYRNNSIAYIQTEDGRAIKEGTTYAYQYDLQDHLGNNRVVFDKGTSGAARELQEDEYYAFGLRNNLFGSNNSNRYLYNGKEIQSDLTNQYDYGARFYDPVIAKWAVPDPIQEDEYLDKYDKVYGEELTKEGYDVDDEAIKQGRNYATSLFSLLGSMSVITPENSAIHYNNSLYTYVMNNPVSYVDAYGLDSSKMLTGVTIKALPANIPHWVGPALIGLGQPISYLKPVGALGSLEGSSIASWGLSKVLPFRSALLKQTTRKVVAKIVGKQIAKKVGTSVVGRFIGRLVPYVGEILTAYDIYDNKEAIGSYINEMQNINIINGNDPLWHVH